MPHAARSGLTVHCSDHNSDCSADQSLFPACSASTEHCPARFRRPTGVVTSSAACVIPRPDVPEVVHHIADMNVVKTVCVNGSMLCIYACRCLRCVIALRRPSVRGQHTLAAYCQCGAFKVRRSVGHSPHASTATAVPRSVIVEAGFSSTCLQLRKLHRQIRLMARRRGLATSSHRAHLAVQGLTMRGSHSGMAVWCSICADPLPLGHHCSPRPGAPAGPCARSVESIMSY